MCPVRNRPVSGLARKGFIKHGTNIGGRGITWTHSYWGEIATGYISADMRVGLYVAHRIHFGFGGKSHSSGSRLAISRDLTRSFPACARFVASGEYGAPIV
jgi:hypothetical protein